jgi:hypothetical protein
VSAKENIIKVKKNRVREKENKMKKQLHRAKHHSLLYAAKWPDQTRGVR